MILITAQFDYLRFNPFDYSKAEYSGNMRFFSFFVFFFLQGPQRLCEMISLAQTSVESLRLKQKLLLLNK